MAMAVSGRALEGGRGLLRLVAAGLLRTATGGRRLARRNNGQAAAAATTTAAGGEAKAQDEARRSEAVPGRSCFHEVCPFESESVRKAKSKSEGEAAPLRAREGLAPDRKRVGVWGASAQA